LLRDKNLRDELRDLLKVLDDRECTIIFQRFGLDGGKPKTLEEVGKKFGVTRERIRQLQNIAVAKLRAALSKKEAPTPKQSPLQLPFRSWVQPTAHNRRLLAPVRHFPRLPEIVSFREDSESLVNALWKIKTAEQFFCPGSSLGPRWMSVGGSA